MYCLFGLFHNFIVIRRSSERLFLFKRNFFLLKTYQHKEILIIFENN